MDAFCALSTPAGISGIAVIRASGQGVIEGIAEAVRVLRTTGDTTGVSLTDLGGYEAAFCAFADPKTQEEIDRVVVTVYRSPYSYTGDDMIEISCHGGSAVRQEILRVLNSLGIRPAGPGEFTRTAFINGKLDLTSAEAVMNVIDADSKRALEAGNTQLMGALRDKITQVENKLYGVLSSIEMMLEFPEHDDTPESLEAVKVKLSEAIDDINRLSSSYGRGRLLVERMKVAIAGLPNAGKSTLLNFFAGFDRAIVTDIPGTTRDTLELNAEVDGIPVTFIDTAGLRQTEDAVEKIGVELAGRAAREADLILYLIAPTDSFEETRKALDSFDKDKLRLVFTKSDAGVNPEKNKLSEIVADPGYCCEISVRQDQNTESITKLIADAYEKAGGINASDVTVISGRHYDLLLKASDKLNQAMELLQTDMGIDVCSQVIRAALDDTGEITGRVVSDELVDTIFSRFCIGK